MASRIHRPLDTTGLTAAPARIKRWTEHARSLGSHLLLWRLLWFPYWFGGDLPEPWLPHRQPEPRTPDSPAARELTGALQAIGRRAWFNTLLTCIARGLWLPFALGSVVALVQIIRDRDWSPERFVWIWAITIPMAIILAFFLRPERVRIASMLDRTFSLRDRMTTALEAIDRPAPTSGVRAPLPYLQIADAANVAIGLKADPRFRIHPPSREISLAILSGLLLMALLFLRGVGGNLPVISEPSVPAFIPAAERRMAAGETNQPIDPDQRPPTVQEVEMASDRSDDAREDLNALADALDDNALTQPAADAIRAGDYATAAQSLRDAASQASNLPPESQAALADALDAAAAATSDSSPGLSNAASQAADGLREGEESAEEGFRDLGDAVELAGESVVPPDVLSDQMAQAQQSAANQQDGADASQAPNSSNSGQGGQSQSNADQSSQSPGDASQSGDSSDAGGADARPGSADSGEQPSDSASEGQESSSSGSESGEQAQSGAGEQSASNTGEPGGAEAGAEAGEQPGANSTGGEGEGSQQGPNDEAGRPGSSSVSQQSDAASNQTSGSGASGASDQTPPADGDQDGAGAATGNQTPSAAPTGTSVSQAPTPSSAGSAPTAVPNQSVSLDDQGGGESIQLGGGGSASSLGSGAGVMVAGGDATQEPVPTAGPQSNRVPEDYRSIVENYFSRDDD